MEYEQAKHKQSVLEFHRNQEVLFSIEHEQKDLCHLFPVFTGATNILRYLSLYEIYKKVINMPGHIADIGVWKGASFVYFIKNLFEN